MNRITKKKMQKYPKVWYTVRKLRLQQLCSIKGVPLSISYGACTLKNTADNMDNAIRIADKQMYLEKEEKKKAR